jgi:hypothetical protein
MSCAGDDMSRVVSDRRVPDGLGDPISQSSERSGRFTFGVIVAFLGVLSAAVIERQDQKAHEARYPPQQPSIFPGRQGLD